MHASPPSSISIKRYTSDGSDNQEISHSGGGLVNLYQEIYFSNLRQLFTPRSSELGDQQYGSAHTRYYEPPNKTGADHDDRALRHRIFRRNRYQNMRICTWSGIRCPSSILHSFRWASSRNTVPKCRLICPNSAFLRYFGVNTSGTCTPMLVQVIMIL